MSEILELQHKIQDTNAIIASLEKDLQREPRSEMLRLNLESVLKRRDQLEREFNTSAEREAVDVCSYRIFLSAEDSKGIVPVRGISSALRDFQIAFSSMFDALKNGRRLRSKITPDILDATSLGFGYAFSGSVGFVLTLQRERLLFGSDLIDDAITTFFSVAQAPTEEDIKAIGTRLGPAPLRAMFKWANDHVEDSLGAEISWRHGTQKAADVFLQTQELERLSKAIAATSEYTKEVVVTKGRLTGAMLKSRTFRFEPDVGDVIKGFFTDAINEEHAVTLPARYRAKLEKLTKILYSSEQEQLTWNLLSLEKI